MSTVPRDAQHWMWRGYWIDRLVSMVKAVDLSPLRVTLIYFSFGFAALYFSDVVLVQQLADPLLSQVQALKGGVEVLLTGGLIYVLTRGSRASLQRTNEELEAARRELGVLHRVLRHNLRNNLTIVAGYADQLEDEVENGDLETYCHAIKTTCEEFTDSIEKTRHLSDLHATGFAATDLDLTLMFGRLQEAITEAYPNATITVDRPAIPDVIAHPHIEFALYELVENGIVHDPAARPSVTVRAQQSQANPHRMRIDIEDSGPGIPESEQAALRHQEETPLLHGSGVGLWVAKWIVLQSDGTFEIENTGESCRVTITLPIPLKSSVIEDESQLAAFVE